MFDFENMAKDITASLSVIVGGGLSRVEVGEKASILGKEIGSEPGMTLYKSPLGDYDVAVVSAFSDWSEMVSKSGGAICAKLEDGSELVIFHNKLVTALRSDEMAALYLHETGHLKNGDLVQGGFHDEKRADDVALMSYPGKVLFGGLVKAIDHCSTANGLGETGILAMRAISLILSITRVVNMVRFWSKTK